jgi:hypothetical protein
MSPPASQRAERLPKRARFVYSFRRLTLRFRLRSEASAAAKAMAGVQLQQHHVTLPTHARFHSARHATCVNRVHHRRATPVGTICGYAGRTPLRAQTCTAAGVL